MTSSTLDKMAHGRHLFFKCENFQRVGAFKFRGMYMLLLSLDLHLFWRHLHVVVGVVNLTGNDWCQYANSTRGPKVLLDSKVRHAFIPCACPQVLWMPSRSLTQEYPQWSHTAQVLLKHTYVSRYTAGPTSVHLVVSRISASPTTLPLVSVHCIWTPVIYAGLNILGFPFWISAG